MPRQAVKTGAKTKNEPKKTVAGKVVKKQAAPKKKVDTPPPSPVAKSTKKPRRRSMKMLGKLAMKLQRDSHRGGPVFNPTQFRRIVVEVLRKGGGTYRISARALEPLQEIVEAQLHRMFKLSRYMCCDVNGRKSINLRNLNLASKIVTRPDELNTYPFDADSFNDDEHGPRIMKVTDFPRRKPKEAKEGGEQKKAKGAGEKAVEKKESESESEEEEGKSDSDE